MAWGHNQSAADDDYYYEETEPNGTHDYGQYEAICTKEDVRSFARAFLPAFYAVAFVVGLAGNAAVVAVYASCKRPRTRTDVYILNLAAADLLLLCTLPLWAANAAHGWVLGTAMCKVTSALYTVNFVSGMQFLACISVDRYAAVAAGPQPGRAAGRACRWVCTCVWAAALLLSAPRLALYTASPRAQCRPVFPHHLGAGGKAALQVLEICVGFVGPLLVMGVCYFATARALLRTPHIKKARPLRVLLAVVVAFIATQLPYNIVRSWQAADIVHALVTDCALSRRLDLAAQVTESIALSHSCLNPLLYVFMGASFKNYIMKAAKRCGSWRRRRESVEEIPFDSEAPTEPTSTFSI